MIYENTCEPFTCNKKRCHKAVRQTPRMCPYLFSFTEWTNDLRRYNKHLKSLYQAKAIVNTRPIEINLRNRLGHTKRWRDMNRVQQIDRENKEFMKRLLAIDRFGGTLDQINTDCYKYRITKWTVQRNKMNTIDKENRILYERMCETEPYYSRSKYMEEWKTTCMKLKGAAKFPFILFKKTSLDEKLKAQPTISCGLQKTGPRFYCYLDFQVQDGEFIGRLIVELYHDYVPATVRNFLHICRGEFGLNYAKCPVYRIVKDRYLETGDIIKGNGTAGRSIYGKKFNEENHILKHSRPGVLSMIRVGNHQNDSKFCITFRNMEEWDKKNVVFGKVIAGASVLEKINGYGRKLGKPMKPIFISKCGELPACNCREKGTDLQCL
ncbi:hypothetical protein WA026_018117 [Henosepilachna vigintioctopunctata]|uniref:PPIase cyclophilin-type domain-containing protein n=1 Tax=Henosepilachna vigintioctopunctata TaxID=420089 RepID=A0AAW1UL05_9CUCU